MNKTEYTSKTEEAYGIKAAGTGTKPFVLWREVAMAYIAPAIMAGIGGLVTGARDLQIAALTSIGGTSALVAWMIGHWLQRRGGHQRWIIRTHRLTVTGLFALAGAALGLFAAWLTTWYAGVMGPGPLPWLSRLWFDFPMSAAIACTTITWRWHPADRQHATHKGEGKK